MMRKFEARSSKRRYDERSSYSRKRCGRRVLVDAGLSTENPKEKKKSAWLHLMIIVNCARWCSSRMIVVLYDRNHWCHESSSKESLHHKVANTRHANIRYFGIEVLLQCEVMVACEINHLWGHCWSISLSVSCDQLMSWPMNLKLGRSNCHFEIILLFITTEIQHWQIIWINKQITINQWRYHRTV